MQDVWKNLNKDNHAWAFFYFLKRKGDNPKVVVKNKTIDIIVEHPATLEGFFINTEE